jgi:hypothetical protein
MFDNTRPNVILLTDSNESAPVGRMLGVARVTQELRNAGFEVAVVYYAGLFEYDELCRLLRTPDIGPDLVCGCQQLVVCHLSHGQRRAQDLAHYTGTQ